MRIFVNTYRGEKGGNLLRKPWPPSRMTLGVEYICNIYLVGDLYYDLYRSTVVTGRLDNFISDRRTYLRRD